MHTRAWTIFALLFFLPVMAWGGAQEVIDERLQSYQAEGAGSFSAEAGERLWKSEHPAPADAESPRPRSCQTCHGQNLHQRGEHVRTGKVIEPMAPSVNPQRYTDAKKIEKWFRRNCKWVMGRACTPQEKGDLLTYLRSL